MVVFNNRNHCEKLWLYDFCTFKTSLQQVLAAKTH